MDTVGIHTSTTFVITSIPIPQNNKKNGVILFNKIGLSLHSLFFQFIHHFVCFFLKTCLKGTNANKYKSHTSLRKKLNSRFSGNFLCQLIAFLWIIFSYKMPRKTLTEIYSFLMYHKAFSFTEFLQPHRT